MANPRRNLFNTERNNLNRNLREEEMEEEAINRNRRRTIREEENAINRDRGRQRNRITNLTNEEDPTFRNDNTQRRVRSRSRAVSPPLRRNNVRVIDGGLRTIALLPDFLRQPNLQNIDPTIHEPDIPNRLPGETPGNGGVMEDFIEDRRRRVQEEQRNPIRAQFYRRGDLTDEQFKQQGFMRLRPGMKVVNNINEATYVEHVLPDGVVEFHPAGNFEEDPSNPDNLLTAQKISDESEIDDEETQYRRSMLRRGGKYRLLYVQGDDRNTAFGGDFKYYLKEDVKFSLAYYGIYKKSEEEKLTSEEIDTNCLVEAFKPYPKQYDILKNNKMGTYTRCHANTFNPICEMIKSNITIKFFSVSEIQVREHKFPSKKAGIKYKNTVTICLFEDHYFPFVKKTEFLTDYIKKCTWKTGETVYDTRSRYLNSFNLVKETLLRKDEYYEEKPKEDIKKKNKKKEAIKKIPKEFADYEQFDDDDSREIKKFDIKKFGVKPKLDPLDPELDIAELEKNGYLTDEVVDDIVNCREAKPKKESLEPIPKKELIEIIFEEKYEEKDEAYFMELEGLLANKKETSYEFEAIYIADVETATDGTYHEAYLICWDKLDGTDKGQAVGIDCCKKFMNHIKNVKEKKITIMFQNFAYDANFVIKCLSSVTSSIEPSRNKNYKTEGFVLVNGKPKKIIFVDQLPKIPMALSKYEPMFKLQKGKFKNFPYPFYNIETAFLPYLTTTHDMYPRLAEIFPKEYLRTSLDGKRLIVHHIDYALAYCHQDIKTQRDGWNCMWKQVAEETGLDYNKILTLSGLAKAVCLKEGCYKGVHEIRGKKAAFIRKCVAGGRVMTALHNKENPGLYVLNEEEGEEYQDGFDYNYSDDEIEPEEKWEEFGFKRNGEINIFLKNKKEKKEKIKIKKDLLPESRINSTFVSPRPRLKPGEKKKKYRCLDANSLYPTAMTRLKGFPIGKPKNISKKDLDSKKFMETADEYFIKIKVLKVEKSYHFPQTNSIGKNGERIWTNNLEGKEMYVDRITLEGLVKDHKIEFECKTGLMFNEGYNTKIGEVVRKFYELRRKYKKENNPLELLYKLLLNNFYGKNIEKPKENKILWTNGKDHKIFDDIDRKYRGCTPITTKIDNRLYKSKIKVGFDTNHWSTPHCGSLILSESKRIMSDVMILVDKHIIYTDTDSMFIDEEGYNYLKKEMPHIFGNDLGQFKIEEHIGDENMYIEEGIFLGKKLYYVKETNEDRSKVYYKIAMKGIPQSSIWYVCRQKFCGSVKKMFYALMYREGGVYFDLLNGGDRIRMNFLEELNVETVDEFGRTLGGYK